jgi:hydroxypyruvate isomerase
MTVEYVGYLDFWFTDRPLVERVAEFGKLGVRRLNVWCWRTMPIDDLAAECRHQGATLNDTFDERGGSLVDAADHPYCLDAWAESLEMAERLGIGTLYLFSDEVGPDGWIKRLSRDYTPEEKYANLLDGVAKVMELVEKTEITVWFEALNTVYIHGGVTVSTHALAADVVRRTNHPQLKMSFDCFHQQLTAGNLIAGLEAYDGLYAAVHIGDVPTRQEPGTGEINFHNVARKLRELEYDGLIGLEFYPSKTEAEALSAVQRILPGGMQGEPY